MENEPRELNSEGKAEPINKIEQQDDVLTPEQKEQRMNSINRELITQKVHPDGLYFDFLARGVDEFDIETPDLLTPLGQFKARLGFYNSFNLNQSLLIPSYLRNPNNNLEQLLINNQSIIDERLSADVVDISKEDQNSLAQSRFMLIGKIGKDLDKIRKVQAMTKNDYIQWLAEEGLIKNIREVPDRINIEGGDVFHKMIDLARTLNEENFNKGRIIINGLNVAGDFKVNFNSDVEPIIYQTKKGPKLVNIKINNQYLDTGGQGWIIIQENSKTLLHLDIQHRAGNYLDEIKENWDVVNNEWPEKLREYFDI